ncbi:hypothetical protein BH23GEM1_BH23GEM1_09290 [soil metagenome]
MADTYCTARAGTVAALLLAAAACVATDERAATDTASAVSPVVMTTPVNRGTYGMASLTKWALSADRKNIIAVVDAVGVEAEAVPNGFFVGLEGNGFQVQVDSVWDVAPSPDWTAIAYGRAYNLMHGESPLIPDEMWVNLSRITGVDTASLRAASFPSSGMSYARAVSRPAIINVPRDPRAAGAADSARPRMFTVGPGWRVRWTSDGTIVAVGSSPRRVQDNEPSPSWAALDPKTGSLHGSLPAGARLVTPDWKSGPTIDISIPVDMTTAPNIQVGESGSEMIIESARGIITLRPVASTGGAQPITVGPGIALAATATGRFILALAPRQKAGQYDHPVELVVYTVTR